MISVYVIMNILIAFIIDVYTSIDEQERIKQKEREEL